MDWKNVITDPDEIKVFMVLDRPNSTWRTAWGIARQAGLPEPRALEILRKYDLQLTRLSEVPSASGSPFVGLLEKVG